MTDQEDINLVMFYISPVVIYFIDRRNDSRKLELINLYESEILFVVIKKVI